MSKLLPKRLQWLELADTGGVSSSKLNKREEMNDGELQDLTKTGLKHFI